MGLLWSGVGFQDLAPDSMVADRSYVSQTGVGGGGGVELALWGVVGGEVGRSSLFFLGVGFEYVAYVLWGCVEMRRSKGWLCLLGSVDPTWNAEWLLYKCCCGGCN
jgi:hypothetical protein